MIHSFFVDRTSAINYMTVGELQQRINGVSEHKFPVRLDGLRP